MKAACGITLMPTLTASVGLFELVEIKESTY
jgi:hypothetical protein